MKQVLTASAVFALFAGALLSQSAPARSGDAPAPTFLAADVHSSPERLHPNIHGIDRGDHLSLRDATLADLISIAYKVDSTAIVGGPTWIDFDRFDINTKSPTGTSQDISQAILRGLLVDRFHLVAHTDTRPLPAFILTIGKGNKMKKADASAEPGGCQYQQQSANSAPPPPGAAQPPIRFSCHNTTMESFAEFLHEVASPYLTRPVFDQTGLQGGWDFDIQWTYQKSGAGGISIFDAVDNQLGLKLESRTAPTPVVVIESVSEKPTPNAPDLDKILPPTPPAQFDVAVVREANPDERNFNIDVEGNRVKVLYATLQTLIYKSYNVQPGLIENKPKWLNDVHWDVIGTASTDSAASSIPGAVPDLDTEEVYEMVRSLLADRFKLVTHAGSRLTTAFVLVADSPKMKKADPANHPTCFEGPLPGGKDPRIDNPLLARLISCQNMTMAQFAVELHTLAAGYVPGTVTDSTGLDGAYDFTVSFSRGDALKSTAAAPTATLDGSAAAPSDSGVGGISLFDALQKQLGVKLEKKASVPTPTLVIDHVEPQPTDN